MTVRLTYPSEWYDLLIEDLRRIGEKANIDFIHAKHMMGTRILKDELRFERAEYGSKTVRSLAINIDVSPREIWRWIQFAKMFRNFEDFLRQYPNPTWKFIRDKVLPTQKRIVSRGTLSPPLPSGKFNVIYADPPWRYNVKLRGTPEDYYPTMSLEEICDIKVPATENAVLFLWATNPMLEDAFKVMSTWGFKYKTNLVWVKNRIGTGFYFRGQHELLLLGVRGDVHPPEESNRFSSALLVDAGKHSEKPDKVYEMIEKMYPNSKYLELFARKKRKGWGSWGNEV